MAEAKDSRPSDVEDCITFVLVSPYEGQLLVGDEARREIEDQIEAAVACKKDAKKT